MARYVVRYQIQATDGQMGPIAELHDDFDQPLVAMMPGLVARLVARQVGTADGEQVIVRSTTEAAQ